ncbi:MAG: calcium-binding protein [Leptolyngbyaceae cyanobacterium SL_7_1]|nr:calcium-binding protein [Leptolyngbyaceae cyanobacterium SL_7_1]
MATITGDDQNNILVGLVEDDLIAPGLGRDIVDGGLGIDTLIVDYSASNRGISYDAGSNPSAGTGTIRSSPNSIQFSNIETFKIIGTSLNDRIFGGSGADDLDGGNGIDTLIKDLSRFTLPQLVDNTTSRLSLIDGTIARNFENLELIMGSGDDTILLNQGDNIIDGGPGTDTLVVNYSTSNRGISYDVGSNPAAGMGTIRSFQNSIQFSNIERFVIIGTALNDRILAGSATDDLDGGNGIDTLVHDLSRFAPNQTVDNRTKNIRLIDGAARNFENLELTLGSGNDTILLNQGDNIINGGLGIDTLVVDYSASNRGISYDAGSNPSAGAGTIRSSPSSIQFSNIERFRITGTSLSDRIIGGSTRDFLTGLGGEDTITGGKGSDQFIFDVGSKFTQKKIGVDTIEDFSRRDRDKIVLDKTTFTALRGRRVSFASVKTLAEAERSRALITYIRGTGDLFYNANGATRGFGGGGHFARFDDGLALAARDFVIQR